MGKIFPYVSNLKEKPELIKETIKLIEDSFQYTTQNSFVIDFAPLIDESNHHNCFILIDENEKVISHIGAIEREIEIKDEVFPIIMIGGIVVDKNARGKGHFQTLMNEVMAEKRSDVSFFMLWSDNEKLYKKFGFYLCGTQYETTFSENENQHQTSSYSLLSEKDKKRIQELYESSFKQVYLTVKRNDVDWKNIEKITSANLFIKRKDEVIESYFFKNKGQDLTDVVYEYGSVNNLDNGLKEMPLQGKLWSGIQISESSELQYGYFIAPGDTRKFAGFVAAYTQSLVKIREVNVMKQEIFFDFKDELYSLEVEDFLRGLFGPGPFEELSGVCRPFFISGLDSI